jgi:hypothetical protein
MTSSPSGPSPAFDEPLETHRARVERLGDSRTNSCHTYLSAFSDKVDLRSSNPATDFCLDSFCARSRAVAATHVE